MTTGYVECQICGRPVFVLLPFVGCAFCGECNITSDSGGWSFEANDEQFKYPYVEETPMTNTKDTGGE